MKIFRCAFVLWWAVALVGCNETKPSSKDLLPVRVAEVQTMQAGNTVRYSANIVPYAQVDLAFKSSGYVESVRQVKGVDGKVRNIDAGDWAPKGTELAMVSQQDYLDKLAQAKAQLSRAQAEYAKAKLSFDRTATLYSQQSATKPDLDSAQAQLDSTAASVASAKAQISEAQVALGYCSLRAPFDGWILKRSVDVGSLVGPATNGFSIADTRSVKAVFGVPDTAIARVRLGQQLAITSDAFPEKFEGRVSSISPAADPKSRVYSVEVTIPNGKDRLKSGMIASLSLGGEQLARPVSAIPLAAVIRDPRQQNGFAVLVANGADDTATVHLRSVELGEAYGNLIGVTSGLSRGEKVVTTGVSLVKDGDSVRVMQ